MSEEGLFFKGGCEMKLVKAGVMDFDTVFRIMDESFPNSEMRTYGGQKKVLKEPAYIVQMNEEKTGFIASWDFGEVQYIEHFAVEREARGSGTGEKMLYEFLRCEKKEVFLEVEPPQDEIARRRIGFYERMGFVLNPYVYIQPPYRLDGEPVQLKIMTYRDRIDFQKFQSYKELLYHFVYRFK